MMASRLSPPTKFIRRATLFVLAVIILIIYTPATNLTFFGDDYLFLEVAGRSTLGQYLSIYFDPRVQTAWYRPMQGMRYGIIYALFGANPSAYHWANVLVHAANCLLLFAILWRISRRWRLATLATLIYSALPLYSITVFWPGVADFVMTLFYLSSVLFWVLYLQEARRRFFLASVFFFLLALLTKELAVTLPITLIVVDLLFLRGDLKLRLLAKKYLPFFIILLLYLPIEYLIQSRGVFVNTYGYGAASPLLSNFFQYLAAMVFPWGLPLPLNYLLLSVAVLLFVYVVISKKSLALLGLAGLGVMTFLPVIPFPWFLTRYLYVPIMIFAILFALLIELTRRPLSRSKFYAPAFSAALALLTFAQGLGIAEAAADFNEIARQSRVPFRDITQRHPQFPNDTFLYFVNPPSPTAEYSGMFFLRYGPGISVSSNEHISSVANLRAHQNSYVIYFDDERRTREIQVEKDLRLLVQPESPIALGTSVRLEQYELASSRAKRGEAIGLILYVKRSDAGDEPTLASLQIVSDVSQKAVASIELPLPSADGANALIAFPSVIAIPSDAPPGNDYRLELVLIDSKRNPLGSKISFVPLSIVE